MTPTTAEENPDRVVSYELDKKTITFIDKSLEEQYERYTRKHVEQTLRRLSIVFLGFEVTLFFVVVIGDFESVIRAGPLLGCIAFAFLLTLTAHTSWVWHSMARGNALILFHALCATLTLLSIYYLDDRVLATSFESHRAVYALMSFVPSLPHLKRGAMDTLFVLIPAYTIAVVTLRIDLLVFMADFCVIHVIMFTGSSVSERIQRKLFEENHRAEGQQAALERTVGFQRELLDQMVPRDLVTELSTWYDGGQRDLIHHSCSKVLVIFLQIQGITEGTYSLHPSDALATVNVIMRVLERAIDESTCLNKIKTVGDTLMVATGTRQDNASDDMMEHVTEALQLAVALPGNLSTAVSEHGGDITLRVGMHLGPVVAAIVGYDKFCYDIFGDTVNVASRMMTHTAPGTVRVTSEVRAHFLTNSDRSVSFGSVECIDVKGKGLLETYVAQRPQ